MNLLKIGNVVSLMDEEKFSEYLIDHKINPFHPSQNPDMVFLFDHFMTHAKISVVEKYLQYFVDEFDTFMSSLHADMKSKVITFKGSEGLTQKNIKSYFLEHYFYHFRNLIRTRKIGSELRQNLFIKIYEYVTPECYQYPTVPVMFEMCIEDINDTDTNTNTNTEINIDKFVLVVEKTVNQTHSIFPTASLYYVSKLTGKGEKQIKSFLTRHSTKDEFCELFRTLLDNNCRELIKKTADVEKITKIIKKEGCDNLAQRLVNELKI